MKPMNDEARKGAMTKAGFFTLIPMVLVAGLVWGGMRGEGNVSKESHNKLKITQDSFNRSKVRYGFIKNLRDSMTFIMAERNRIEKTFFSKIANEDTTGILGLETDLISYEEDINNYLLTQNSLRKKLDDKEHITKDLISQYQDKLSSKKVIRSFKVNKPGLNFDELREQISELEDEIKTKDKEIYDLKEKSLGASPQIENLRRDLKESNKKNGILEKDIKEQKRKELAFLEDAYEELEYKKRSGKFECKKCYNEVVGKGRASLEARIKKLKY